MANHASAVKRARQNERRRERNRAERSKLRSERKQFQTIVAAGDREAAAAALNHLQVLLAKSAAKGVIHKNKAARLLSRAARKLPAAH